MDLHVRRMDPDELEQATAIDLSERGSVLYQYTDGRLQTVAHEWRRSSWTAEQWRRNLDDWLGHLGMDLIVGAFDGDQLVGMASLRYRISETVAHLVSVHVTRSHRRQGIATRLVEELMAAAVGRGVTAVYVLAEPTESAIGFYLSQGFQPVDRYDLPWPVDQQDTEDIHMMCTLASQR